MTVRIGDLRRFLEYFVFLTRAGTHGFAPGNSIITAWACILRFLEVKTPGTSEYLGWCCNNGTWTLSQSAKTLPKLYDACMFFAANAMYRENIIGIDLANGSPRLAPRPHCSSSLLCWWESKTPSRKNYIELDCNGNTAPPISMRQLCPEVWQKSGASAR